MYELVSFAYPNDKSKSEYGIFKECVPEEATGSLGNVAVVEGVKELGKPMVDALRGYLEG